MGAYEPWLGTAAESPPWRTSQAPWPNTSHGSALPPPPPRRPLPWGAWPKTSHGSAPRPSHPVARQLRDMAKGEPRLGAAAEPPHGAPAMRHGDIRAMARHCGRATTMPRPSHEPWGHTSHGSALPPSHHHGAPARRHGQIRAMARHCRPPPPRRPLPWGHGQRRAMARRRGRATPWRASYETWLKASQGSARRPSHPMVHQL